LGHPGDPTSLLDKILNDLEIKPARFITEFDFDLSKFEKISGIPLNSRREEPRVFLSPKATEGYRVFYGIFDFSEKLHGALLLNPKGKLKNYWPLSHNNGKWENMPDKLLSPHGFQIARDGSIVATADNSHTLNKYNYCGEVVWRLRGTFDHAISFTDNQKNFWVLGKTVEDYSSPKKYRILKIDYQNGKILKKIAIDELIKKNQEIDPFRARQIKRYSPAHLAEGDPWHLNDAEALPPKFADKYPLFKAGDLLLSFRNLNLICVIDPDNLKIKWWRQGLTRTQHDPDWNSRGTITVFNNNMLREFSNITEINPNNYNYSFPVKGENYNFYSQIRGKHQLLNNGNFLITSSEQGRVFEVNPEGEIVFEFFNLYNKENNEYLLISDSEYLPPDYFINLPKCDK